MIPVHTPVMLQEVLTMLSPDGDNQLLVDSTLGEGGHTCAFLEKYPSLHVIGLDADAVIQSRARERLAGFGDRVSFYNTWFNDFYSSYPTELPAPNRILFDLGISVFHYELSGRGFTFRSDEPLDMRLNPLSGESAADIVNTRSAEDLANIIYEYGEERYSRRIARAVVEKRTGSKIQTAKELADIIWNSVPGDYRHGRLHPATRTFQALRIAVNRELSRLPQALADAFSVLAPGGIMGVITFHSLEDRIVKNFFRDKAKKCTCPPEQPICNCGGRPAAELLTRKALEPSAEEVAVNAPSRSARFRCARKICYDEVVR